MLEGVAVAAEYGGGSRRFVLATGSPGELGLLEALGNAFGAEADARLIWVKAGTGQSLDLLQAGKVDMAMVHAPVQVDRAVAEGWATNKTLIGANEFFIVGPESDPAHIAQATDAVDACRRIVAAGATFVSRGDNSGTHQKEMQLWAMANAIPVNDRYIVTHDFMTDSLRIADRNGAYYMTDSSTWIMEQGVAPSLRRLFSGDRLLVNIYHAIAAASGATPERDTAAEFIAFVASPAGQKIMREFGADRYSGPLYNDLMYAKQYENSHA